MTNARAALPYNLPYKWGRLQPAGDLTCLQLCRSDRCSPSDAFQKCRLDQIISAAL
jgi:hypothetical protein